MRTTGTTTVTKPRTDFAWKEVTKSGNGWIREQARLRKLIRNRLGEESIGRNVTPRNPRKGKQ